MSWQWSRQQSIERKLNPLEICLVGSQGYSMKLNQQSESNWRVWTGDDGYTGSHLDRGVGALEVWADYWDTQNTYLVGAMLAKIEYFIVLPYLLMDE